MSGKIRHLDNICENISLRNRGKRRGQTEEDRGHSCLEKALLALINDSQTSKKRVNLCSYFGPKF